MENLQSLNNNLFILGIAGGTGSGKTYLTNQLIDKFGENIICSIPVDSYYLDLSHLSLIKRAENNFDHPNSFDFDLLTMHIKQLIKGKSINIPTYDYKTHTRNKKTINIDSTYKIIIIEGIYALYHQRIREYLNCSVFIEINNEIRKNRRLKRDVKKRSRTIDSILLQYDKHVNPMFKEYIEPTIKHADLIIKKFENSDLNFIKLISTINSIIK